MHPHISHLCSHPHSANCLGVSARLTSAEFVSLTPSCASMSRIAGLPCTRLQKAGSAPTDCSLRKYTLERIDTFDPRLVFDVIRKSQLLVLMLDPIAIPPRTTLHRDLKHQIWCDRVGQCNPFFVKTAYWNIE